MKWRLPNDDTAPVITAQRMIKSSHGANTDIVLPETCVMFEIGMAMRYIEETRQADVLVEKLPCFLDSPKCISLCDYPSVCFTRGGYGAPAAVETLETLLALGVKRIIIAGMCGGFSQGIDVGNVIIPDKILSEEGTSRHYFTDHEYSYPDRSFFQQAVHCLEDASPVCTNATVTTDAVYRQTFVKEAMWRKMGCVGVDMESSALLSVCRFYDIPAVSILIVSDKHPISPDQGPWQWGKEDFSQTKRRFVDRVVDFALGV